MNIHNTKRLIEASPSLYGDRFCFECGDGWFSILLEASIKIESILQGYPKQIRDDVVAMQVKEKYGTLRFYISYYTEELDEIIDSAEKASCSTCEVCGNLGKLRGTRWLYAACDEHTHKHDLISPQDVADK